MPTLTNLWSSLGTGHLVTIVLAWFVSFGMLAIAYARAKRWDRAWKDRWEQRHGIPLASRRVKLQRTLSVTLASRWIMFAAFFMSVGFGLGPIITAIKGLHRDPALVIVLFSVLNLLVLLVLLLVAAGVELLRYQLRRIDELLAASRQ